MPHALVCTAIGAVAVLGVSAPMNAIAAEAAPDVAAIEVKPVRLAENFYVIDEAAAPGGSVSVFTGPDGVLIVDTGRASLAPKVEAAIKALSPQPIRYVVNTHIHAEETEANEYFGRRGAVVVATEAVRYAMTHPRPLANGVLRKVPPAPAQPSITYTEAMALHLNGQEIRLVAAPKAHTDGDTLIHFPALDVIVAGDVLRANEWPSINRNDSGTLSGMLDGLARLIGMAGPQTKIVTSHGEVVGRDVAIAQRDLILAVRGRIAALLGQGRSVDEVVAANVTANLGVTTQTPHTPAERFVRDMYAELRTNTPSR